MSTFKRYRTEALKVPVPSGSAKAAFGHQALDAVVLQKLQEQLADFEHFWAPVGLDPVFHMLK